MGTLHNREYWKNVIVEIETNVRNRSKKYDKRKYDLSFALPKHLRDRANKVMPYEFDDYDRKVFLDESSLVTPESSIKSSDDELRKIKEKKNLEFRESACSEVEHLENIFPHFEFKIDTPIQHVIQKKGRKHWTNAYICKSRKERVKWDSKIYQINGDISDKTLDEQAEQLMDGAADHFMDWLESLGGGSYKSQLTKDKLKALFSIEGERKLLASMQTEPKEVKAIAKAVADKWHLPEMAIELKYENYKNKILKNVQKKIITTAFGRTIPIEERPWLPSEMDVPIITVFPAELLSGQKLFKGIRHLRSTKGVVSFYKQRPHLCKPSYLVKSGEFKERRKRSTHQEIPLYELLKLPM